MSNVNFNEFESKIGEQSYNRNCLATNSDGQDLEQILKIL